MKYTYIIPGDPIPTAHIRNGERKGYDAQRTVRGQFVLHITNQHNDQPLIYGPLHLQIHFFMPIPKTYNASPGSPYYTIPRLSHLIAYVEECVRGILLPDVCTIVSIESTKSYDNNPRVEFSLTTLKKEGKVWKHQLLSPPLHQ